MAGKCGGNRRSQERKKKEIEGDIVKLLEMDKIFTKKDGSRRMERFERSNYYG